MGKGDNSGLSEVSEGPGHTTHHSGKPLRSVEIWAEGKRNLKWMVEESEDEYQLWS